MEMGLRFKTWGLSADEVRLALYAALLLPLASVRYLEKKKKPAEVARCVFWRALCVCLFLCVCVCMPDRRLINHQPATHLPPNQKH
jgi:hypothetical protein